MQKARFVFSGMVLKAETKKNRNMCKLFERSGAHEWRIVNVYGVEI